MKKSNIILVILLCSLYLIPVFVWGICKISAKGDYYTGFGDDIQTVYIENTVLTKEDIIVNSERVSAPAFQAVSVNQYMNSSYLYYKGSKKYYPEINKDGNVLTIGKAIDAPNTKLKLHIRINDISEIMLNGESVWRR
jgi:hypothetical protein